MKIKVTSNSVEETIAIGEKIASVISSPKVISLYGDLGAGKTHFVKGLAIGLGSFDQVTSPTFTIMNEYQGRMPIYHFDMYRLSSAEEAEGLGFAEFFDKSTLRGVSVVEWPENVEGLIPNDSMKITIQKADSDSARIITIEEGI